MKKLLLSVFVLIAVACQNEPQRQISIFCDHIDDIARQEGISFSEAAGKIRQLGYNGVDVSVSISERKLNTLDSLGFGHACAIAHIDFVRGENPEECRKALDFMHEHDYSILLLVPGLLPENAEEGMAEAAYVRIAAFVRQALDEGFDVMVEDYDNPRSICYNTPALDRLFEAVPALNHVYDSGNYMYCGEDVMTAFRHFRERIHHVHLKDRNGAGSGVSPAVGTGVVPIREVMVELLNTGYDGWFTVEHYGSMKMLEDATVSIANVVAVYEELQK